MTDPSTGTLLGGVALERYLTSSRPTFLLRSLVVSPRARSRGLGRELVACAVRAAEDVAGDGAMVALLTETADDYFPDVGLRP